MLNTAMGGVGATWYGWHSLMPSLRSFPNLTRQKSSIEKVRPVFLFSNLRQLVYSSMKRASRTSARSLRGTVEVLEVRTVMDATGLDVIVDEPSELFTTDDWLPNIGPYRNALPVHSTNTTHGNFLLAKGEDYVQLWVYHRPGSNRPGKYEMLFEWGNYTLGETRELFDPMLKDNRSLYFDLINLNGETEIWSYRFRDEAIELIPAFPEHVLPPESEDFTEIEVKLPDGIVYLPHIDLENSIRIPDIVLAYGLHAFSPVWGLGNSIVDFKLSRDSSQELGSINNGVLNETEASSNNSFTEWENVTGGLWVTVGKEMRDGPVDLTWVTKTNNTWLNDPEITQSLGDSFEMNTTEEEDGVRVSTATLKGIDLSQYVVGERVLVAKVVYSANADDPVGIPVSTDGYHSDPIGGNVIRLVGARLGGTTEAIAVAHDIPGKFYPVVYDTNDDGKVNLRDLAAFIPHFGKTNLSVFGEEAYRYDFNRDFKINLLDFQLFIQEYASQKLTETQKNSVSTSPFVQEEPKTIVIGSQIGEWSYYAVAESLVSELGAELDSSSIDDYLQWVAESDDPLEITWPLPWNTQVDDRILAALEAGYLHRAGDLSCHIDDDEELTST